MKRRTALWATAAVAIVVVAIVWISFPQDDRHTGDRQHAGACRRTDTRRNGRPQRHRSRLTRERDDHARASRAGTGIPDEIRAVVYRSTSGDGQPTEVSGSVFVPRVIRRAGGWPVVAVGHGTTGIDEPCAPSLSNTLLGYAETVGILITKGYAVALPDYQGLGAPECTRTPIHALRPEHDRSVRALRATFRTYRTDGGRFGGSQGGGAAWAADEQAHDYAPELTLVGAVSVSPVG